MLWGEVTWPNCKRVLCSGVIGYMALLLEGIVFWGAVAWPTITGLQIGR